MLTLMALYVVMSALDTDSSVVSELLRMPPARPYVALSVATAACGMFVSMLCIH